MRLEKFGYIVKNFLDSGRGIVLLFAFEKAEISPGELKAIFHLPRNVSGMGAQGIHLVSFENSADQDQPLNEFNIPGHTGERPINIVNDSVVDLISIARQRLTNLLGMN